MTSNTKRLSYAWQKRVAKVCDHFRWYHYTFGWYLEGSVSAQKIKDGVKFLEALKRQN